MDRRKFVTGALAAPMMGALSSRALAQAQAQAQAQAWPSRNITMVVAFPPGGQADLAARPIALSLEKTLGKSVIVDNRAGAGGLVGNAFVARSEPDGYTLLMALSSMTFLPDAERLYDRKPSYELDSFVPIARALADPNVLCVRHDAPWKSVAELVEDARKRPGVISYSSSGNYGATHIPFEMFERAAGVKFLHVPYRGGGPAMQDLMGGRIDYFCTLTGTAVPQIENGAIKAIAVMTHDRAPMLPNVPSTWEQGFKDFEASTWFGFYVPKGTPAAVIKRLRDATVEAIDTPAVQEQLLKSGSIAVSPDRRSTEYLKAFTESEIAKNGAPIKAAGMSIE